MVIAMKKTFLVIIVVFMMIGVCGCKVANNETRKTKGASEYLCDKYGDAFAFVSEEGSAWPVKTKYYNYKDSNENVFKVSDENGFYTDNYGSVMFDTMAEESVLDEFSEIGKFYINTSAEFFSKSRKFSSHTEYLQACAVVDVAVYTTQKDTEDIVANKVAELFEDCTISLTVYWVDDETYNGVDENSNIKNELSSKEYWIRNNQIT